MNSKHDNETNKGTDFCAPMAMREVPTELRLALAEQRIQSTQRHKDALEGLAVDHHRHIEQLTEQLFYERQNYEQQLNVTMHERDAKTNRLDIIEDMLRDYADDLAQLADPKNWSGSICTANAAQERLANLAVRIRGLSEAKNSIL